MDRLYLFSALHLLCDYDSFWGIIYSWLGIGFVQEVIINVSQQEVSVDSRFVVEHNVMCSANKQKDIYLLSKT